MKLMNRAAAVMALALLVLSTSARSMTPEQRKEYRENLLKILPDSPPFKERIVKTAALPPDFDELLATIAPRPVFVYSPQLNRDATAEDIAKAVAAADKVYGLFNAGDNLVLEQPWEFHGLSGEAQDQIKEWMNKKMK
jgi:hypothetical protein